MGFGYSRWCPHGRIDRHRAPVTCHLTWRQRADMASVEAPSLTTTALVHISAFLFPLRDLFVESFSGPGSYSRIIATLFVLGNLKNVPFAWHVRFRLQSVLYELTQPAVPRLERSALPLPLQQTQHTLQSCTFVPFPASDNRIVRPVSGIRLQFA
jgi:hypothetical protein